jgi:hypothetical protein
MFVFSQQCALVSAFSCSLMLCGIANAQSDQNRDSLRGIKSARVVVSIDDALATLNVDESTIKAVVENKLRKSGLVVDDAPGADALIHVQVQGGPYHDDESVCAISVAIEVNQFCELKNRKAVMAMTWWVRRTMAVPSNVTSKMVNDGAGGATGRLVEEWKAVN